MQLCVKQANTPLQGDLLEGFVEQTTFLPFEGSFYLALGTGFLDTMIRQTDDWAASRIQRLESLAQSLEPLEAKLSSQGNIKIALRLAQALTQPPKVLQERLSWLDSFTTKNHQGACLATQVFVRTVLAHCAGPSAYAEVFDLVKSPTQHRVYLQHFCTALQVGCRLTDRTGAAQDFGPRTEPSFYLHQDSPDSYSLLVHQQHLAQQRNEMVNIQKFPFVLQETPPLWDLVEALSQFCLDHRAKENLLTQLNAIMTVNPKTNTIQRLLKQLSSCRHSVSQQYLTICGVSHCAECLREKLNAGERTCLCGVRMSPKNCDEIQGTPALVRPSVNGARTSPVFPRSSSIPEGSLVTPLPLIDPKVFRGFRHSTNPLDSEQETPRETPSNLKSSEQSSSLDISEYHSAGLPKLSPRLGSQVVGNPFDGLPAEQLAKAAEGKPPKPPIGNQQTPAVPSAPLMGPVGRSESPRIHRPATAPRLGDVEQPPANSGKAVGSIPIGSQVPLNPFGAPSLNKLPGTAALPVGQAKERPPSPSKIVPKSPFLDPLPQPEAGASKPQSPFVLPALGSLPEQNPFVPSKEAPKAPSSGKVPPMNAPQLPAGSHLFNKPGQNPFGAKPMQPVNPPPLKSAAVFPPQLPASEANPFAAPGIPLKPPGSLNVPRKVESANTKQCTVCNQLKDRESFELVVCPTHDICSGCRVQQLQQTKKQQCPVCGRGYSDEELQIIQIASEGTLQLSEDDNTFWCARHQMNFNKRKRVRCQNKCNVCNQCGIQNGGFCPECQKRLKARCSVCSEKFSWKEVKELGCGHLAHLQCSAHSCSTC